jgi:hypothetical protein
VTLQVDVSNTNRLTGTVTDGVWLADLRGNRALFSVTNASPFAGNYTLALRGTNGGPLLPEGDGFGRATVSSAGQIKLTGVLADAAKLTQTATVSENGEWPLYVSLYGGQGQVIGWLTFTNGFFNLLGGPVSWFKPAVVNGKLYPAGFDFTAPVTGGSYDPLAIPLATLPNGYVALVSGNLPANITNLVRWSGTSTVTNLSTNKLTLKLSTATGLFKGAVVDPATAKSIPFSGVVLQHNNGEWLGYFLNAGRSGEVIVAP